MALAAAKRETSRTQLLENLLKVKPMLLQGSGVDKYIVKIGGDKGESSANCIHQSQERAGGTTKPKWHPMPGLGEKAVLALSLE